MGNMAPKEALSHIIDILGSQHNMGKLFNENYMHNVYLGLKSLQEWLSNPDKDIPQIYKTPENNHDEWTVKLKKTNQDLDIRLPPAYLGNIKVVNFSGEKVWDYVGALRSKTDEGLKQELDKIVEATKLSNPLCSALIDQGRKIGNDPIGHACSNLASGKPWIIRMETDLGFRDITFPVCPSCWNLANTTDRITFSLYRGTIKL